MDAKVLVAAETIKKALPLPKGQFSIADISAKSGLSLRDAEVGLQYLTSEFRGHLAATSKGELVFDFPYGFAKPWEKTEALERAWSKVKKALLGVAKIVVRAWISVVMIGYVVIFALILLALFASKKSDRDDDREGGGGGMMFAMLFRLVADSLFWTFHPFSPYYADARPQAYGRRKAKDDLPFYEKVNRYFFGPEEKPKDPTALPRKMVELIRAKRGRIGVTDVMKVTGLTPRESDPLLAKLMLDYDGDVSVSEDGSLVYTFKEIRKTVQNSYIPEPAPIWATREKVQPLTGNSGGINTIITMLNGFNLLMSTVAISQGWTIEKLTFIVRGVSRIDPWTGMANMPIGGTPLLLGWIPFAFSAVLFSIPVLRWMNKAKEKRKVDRENGRRGLLFAVLNSLTTRGLTEQTIKSAWEKISGAPADEKAILKEVVHLGGDIEISDDGKTVYRFKQIEREIAALSVERRVASDDEKDVGAVVFSSAN